jgi:hypothetical protein
VVKELRSFVGSKLMRKVAVRKAPSQYFEGMDKLARRAIPTSTIWRCLLSAEPFC